MNIRLNIDKEELQEKPAQFDGRLRNRLCSRKSIMEVQPEYLIEAVKSGRSFTPAVMTGTTGDKWQSQQVICADIDNDTGKKDADGHKIQIDNPLTPEHALEVMNQYGIDPYFMYYSFSNKAEWVKFRIVLVLDEPLTDPAAANDYIARFTGIFNKAAYHCADTTASDNARLFYGGKKDSVFYVSGCTTSAKSLQALPVYEEPAAELKPQQIQQHNTGTSYTELQEKFAEDKANFDLASYVQRTTTSRPVMRGRNLFFNPCPICGHKDDFHVTGAIYYCHSASGGTGGSIIDYLMNRENIDKGAACDKFKFEIMGYDRNEWKQAYIAETYPERLDIDEKYKQHKEALAAAGQNNMPIDAETPQEGTERAKTGAETLAEFLATVQQRDFEPIPTGITDLDRALEGGFTRKTLVMLGAAPGMGKTALAQWIFENMASAGHDVLYINLEMAREQLLARSLSRLCWKYEKQDVSALDILRGYAWNDETRQAITRTAERYKADIAEHFIYNPAGVSNNINSILSAMQAATARLTGQGKQAPIICIDYLQMIDSGERDAVEGMKNVIKRLKDFAIEHNTVVFLIMANNRAANKSGAADMESGRDTSAIEYSGDLLLGLAFTAIDERREYESGTDKKGEPVYSVYDLDEIRRLKKEAQKQGREVPAVCKEVSVIVNKNRFGEDGRRANLIFDGKHSTFYLKEYVQNQQENPFASMFEGATQI